MARQLTKLINFENKMRSYEERISRRLEPTELARLHRETVEDYSLEIE